MADGLTLDQQKAIATASARKRMSEASDKPKEPESIMGTAHDALSAIGGMWPEGATPTDIALIPAAIGGEGLALKGAEVLTGMATRAMPRVAQTIAETPEISGAVNLGKAAGAGAAGWGGAGAASGAVNAPPGGRIEGAIKGAESGAKMGAEFGAGGAVLGKGIEAAGGKLASKGAETPTLNADEIRALSHGEYAKVPKDQQLLDVSLSNKFLDEAMGAAEPKSNVGKILEEDDPKAAIAKKFAALRDTNMTMKDVQDLDEYIGSQASKFYKTGGMEKEGQKLLELQETFREMADEAIGENNVLSNARYYWTNARKASDIEQIIERASQANDKVSSMKSQFSTLLANKKRMRPFTDEEKKLIEKASKTGIVDELLRLPGSRLFPIGKLAAGGNLGSVAGAKAASMAANEARKAYQVNKAGKVLKEISSNVQKRRAAPPPPPAPVSQIDPEIEARRAIGGY